MSSFSVTFLLFHKFMKRLKKSGKKLNQKSFFLTIRSFEDATCKLFKVQFSIHVNLLDKSHVMHPLLLLKSVSTADHLFSVRNGVCVQRVETESTFRDKFNHRACAAPFHGCGVVNEPAINYLLPDPSLRTIARTKDGFPPYEIARGSCESRKKPRLSDYGSIPI